MVLSSAGGASKQFPSAATTAFKLLTVDGLRVTTPHDWFLIRHSNTEPLITGQVEANSKTSLARLGD